jgi:hypothetical protein
MLWINLVAIVCLILGFVIGWRTIRKHRLPFEPGNAILSWKENPAPTFQQDRLAGACIVFHACAIIVLSVLLIISVNRAAPSPFSLEFHSPTEVWLRRIVAVEDLGLKSISMVAAVLAAGIGGFTLGVIVSFPFVRWFVRPILVHIVPDGLIYGNFYTPWQDISRWGEEAKRRIIRMYAKKPAGALIIVLHPPNDALFKEVEEKIRSILPLSENGLYKRSPRQRMVTALVFFLGTSFLLAIAFWAYGYRAEWVWFLYGVEIVALELGGRYIIRV